MTKRPQLILPAVILGLIFLAIAAIYMDRRRGIPALVLPRATRQVRPTCTSSTGWPRRSSASGCFVFAWFQTGGAPQRNRAA